MIDLQKHLSSDSDYFSGINIVPFTDVVLVLLIIFMIAAPGIARAGMDIKLPGAKSGKSARNVKITIGVDRSGKIWIDGKPVAKKQIRPMLAQKMKENKQTSVVLNADQDLKHGSVISILDSIRLAGIKKIYVGAVRK